MDPGPRPSSEAELTWWRIVPLLRRTGYDVDFREFSGGHEVPPDMVDAAVVMLTA